MFLPFPPKTGIANSKMAHDHFCLELFNRRGDCSETFSDSTTIIDPNFSLAIYFKDYSVELPITIFTNPS